MRWLPLLLLAACVTTLYRKIGVPKTDDAQKCWRECKQIEATCKSRSVGPDAVFARLNLEARCEKENRECAATCLGAYEYWVDADNGVVDRDGGEYILVR